LLLFAFHGNADVALTRVQKEHALTRRALRHRGEGINVVELKEDSHVVAVSAWP